MNFLEVSLYGLPTNEEIRDFEIANCVRLPQDYRIFLSNINGGVPKFKQNPHPKTVVSYILGMHNGDYHASLYKQIEMFSGRLPLSTFPIASDSFGNLFIMSLHPESFGYIYFWDHEREPENQDGHCVENTSFVSYNFTEFISNLK